jgi:hypothetical protein
MPKACGTWRTGLPAGLIHRLQQLDQEKLNQPHNACVSVVTGLMLLTSPDCSVRQSHETHYCNDWIKWISLVTKTEDVLLIIDG